MTNLIETIMILLVLTNFASLGSSRMTMFIRAVATQGIALGILSLLMHSGKLEINLIVLCVVIIGLKGIMFPWLLSWTLREVYASREEEPFIGYGTSVMLGPLLLVICLVLGSRLPLPVEITSNLVVPVAFFTIMSGLFLIISRKKAITQVLGYIVMENGIYIVGVALAGTQSFLVEFGILLDVFVAVFVMGITIFHINREFEHIDTDRLSHLRS